MERYVPSNKFKPNAIWAVLGASIAAGLIAGIVAQLIGEFFRLLVIFELVMGLVAGFGASWAIKKYHMRAPVLAVLLAIVGGSFAIVGDEGLAFFRARSEVSSEFTKWGNELQLEGITDDNIGVAVDAVFAYSGEEVNDAQLAATMTGAPLTLEDGSIVQPLAAPQPWETALGWLRSRTEAGMTIGKVGREGDEVGSTGTLIWMLVGFLIVLGTAAFIAFAEARSPYDEENEDWYPGGGAVSGLGHADGKKGVVAAFKDNNITNVAPSIVAEGKPKKGYLLVELSHVNPNGKWLLNLTHQVNEKTSKPLGNYLASRSEVDMLLGSVAKKLDPGGTKSDESASGDASETA